MANGLIYEQLEKGYLKTPQGEKVGSYTVNTLPKRTTEHPAKKNGKKNGKKKPKPRGVSGEMAQEAAQSLMGAPIGRALSTASKKLKPKRKPNKRDEAIAKKKAWVKAHTPKPKRFFVK